MTEKNPKNIPVSVRQRLLNRSKQDKRPFNELLQYYSMERFLYRLSLSTHAHRFILKGGLMLRVWESPMARPTMDIDMLGVTSNEEQKIVTQIQEMLSVDVIYDGLTYDPKSIKTTKILEDADYEGIQVTFLAKLDTAKIKIQMDIGFGDIVFPAPEMATFPALLNFPAPYLLCYSKESAIAEKFDAMMARGMTNSRMKDFFDIWLLSRQYNFEIQTLASAIRLTLAQRKTELQENIIAFSDEFINIKQTQWTAFRNRLQLDYAPESFKEVISAIELFLLPITSVITSKESTLGKWNAPGPWM